MNVYEYVHKQTNSTTNVKNLFLLVCRRHKLVKNLFCWSRVVNNFFFWVAYLFWWSNNLFFYSGEIANLFFSCFKKAFFENPHFSPRSWKNMLKMASCSQIFYDGLYFIIAWLAPRYMPPRILMPLASPNDQIRNELPIPVDLSVRYHSATTFFA